MAAYSLLRLPLAPACTARPPLAVGTQNSAKCGFEFELGASAAAGVSANRWLVGRSLKQGQGLQEGFGSSTRLGFWTCCGRRSYGVCKASKGGAVLKADEEQRVNGTKVNGKKIGSGGLKGEKGRDSAVDNVSWNESTGFFKDERKKGKGRKGKYNEREKGEGADDDDDDDDDVTPVNDSHVRKAEEKNFSPTVSEEDEEVNEERLPALPAPTGIITVQENEVHAKKEKKKGKGKKGKKNELEKVENANDDDVRGVNGPLVSKADEEIPLPSVSDEEVDSVPAYKEALEGVLSKGMLKLQDDCSQKFNRLSESLEEKVIHDLRVVLRRLRNAVNTFRPFIELPKVLEANKISQLLRVLGTLRDADVMQERLDDVRKAALDVKEEEVKALTALQERLKTERSKVISKSVHVLQGKSAVSLEKSLLEWAKKPHFKTNLVGLGSSSSGLVVPALLVQQAAHLLLHPAWHVDDLECKEEGVRALGIKEKKTSSKKSSAIDSLPTLDGKQCATMHDLRKNLRELRYSMELLQPVYGGHERFERVLSNVRKLQSVLGDLQDLHVLSSHLQQHLPGGAPSLQLSILERHREAWSSWLETRALLYSAEGQKDLLKALSKPKGPKGTGQPKTDMFGPQYSSSMFA